MSPLNCLGQPQHMNLILLPGGIDITFRLVCKAGSMRGVKASMGTPVGELHTRICDCIISLPYPTLLHLTLAPAVNDPNPLAY